MFLLGLSVSLSFGDRRSVGASNADALPGVAPILTQKPMSAQTSSYQDCASCHPRQVAEWEQSVMAHSVESPLFNALEMLIEEQVGRDNNCPLGAGILRPVDPDDACRDEASGRLITGSGGEQWCVNCHAPGQNLSAPIPAWSRRSGGRSHRAVRDLITDSAREGISCAFCHQVHGPVRPDGRSAYRGNPDWTSFLTGIRYESRPESRLGQFGIANSGYQLDPSELIPSPGSSPPRHRLATVGNGEAFAHLRPSDSARDYLRSSAFCGSCHDVRLFGTDVLGARRGEHFKRLRNAYSEWEAWAAVEQRAGRRPASCQDCHMSTYPGVCVPASTASAASESSLCPQGMRFEPHQPGRRPQAHVAAHSGELSSVAKHYFTSVDLPLSASVRDDLLDRDGVDMHGVPLSARRRRDALLHRSIRFELGKVQRRGTSLEIPVVLENVGAGHKVPAGFSQERELWVHLRVEDAVGEVVYEVGRVDRDDEDLRDKQFLRVNTNPDQVDARGRPVGLFGADVVDGPDVPRWSAMPPSGEQVFRGLGLINFQNGFLRCVRCIGTIDAEGECRGRPGEPRAAAYVDGDYDVDSGRCTSNLEGSAALFEIYFPVGALDAQRGLFKGPDAIIDTRSLTPRQPVRYHYQLSTAGHRGPYRVVARLMFRAFPPFLIRAFADYEQVQARRGRRPGGALITHRMLARLERVQIKLRKLVIP